ncbi:MAG: hypothetical protein QM778_17700 [Myxococcales bacterium]
MARRLVFTLALGVACTGCAGELEDDAPLDDTDGEGEQEVSGTEQALTANSISTGISGQVVRFTTDDQQGYVIYDYTSVASCQPGDPKMPLVESFKSGGDGTRKTLFGGAAGGALNCKLRILGAKSDGTDLYLAASLDGVIGEMYRVRLADGFTSSVPNTRGADALLVDSTSLYWTKQASGQTPSALMKANKTGSGLTTLYFAPAGHSMRLLGGDSVSVYAETWDPSLPASTQVHFIRWIPLNSLNGGTPAILRKLAPGHSVSGFSVDPGNVYVNERVAGEAAGLTWTSLRDGKNYKTLFTSTGDFPSGILAVFRPGQPSRIYWVERGDDFAPSMSELRSMADPTNTTLPSKVELKAFGLLLWPDIARYTVGPRQGIGFLQWQAAGGHRVLGGFSD